MDGSAMNMIFGLIPFAREPVGNSVSVVAHVLDKPLKYFVKQVRQGSNCSYRCICIGFTSDYL